MFQVFITSLNIIKSLLRKRQLSNKMKNVYVTYQIYMHDWYLMVLPQFVSDVNYI